MASNLQDAKITVKVDTEGAESTLDEMEKRLKKDRDAIRKASREEKGKEKKKKEKGRGLLSRARGFAQSGAMMGALPYAQTISAAMSVIEYGGPAMMTALEEAMEGGMGNIPFAEDITKSVVESMQSSINALSERITEIKSKIEALGVAKDEGLDILRTQAGLGIEMQDGFLGEHLRDVLQIAEVQSQLRADVKKHMAQNLGKQAGKIFADYIAK